MPNKSKILNIQSAIDQARQKVQASQVKIEEIQIELIQLEKEKPTDKTEKNRIKLTRELDDTLDQLDTETAKLSEAINSYSNLKETAQLPELESEISSLTKKRNDLSVEVKKNKEKLTQLETAEKKAILELNEAGYKSFHNTLKKSIIAKSTEIKNLEKSIATNDKRVLLQKEVDKLQSKINIETKKQLSVTKDKKIVSINKDLTTKNKLIKGVAKEDIKKTESKLYAALKNDKINNLLKEKNKISLQLEKYNVVAFDATKGVREIALKKEQLGSLKVKIEKAEKVHTELQKKTNNISELLKVYKGIDSKTNLALDKLTLGIDELATRVSFIYDPRYSSSKLKDDTPILLFPVRVETRFMTIKHVRRNKPTKYVPSDNNGGKSKILIKDKKELWVRIFPDDIATSTHEEKLTLEEQTKGHSYWTEFFESQAQGEDSQGFNLGTWSDLVGAFGPERSAWITKTTKPTNFSTVSVAAELVFPTLDLKQNSWTEAPKSHIMPERFVVRLYTNRREYTEHLGGVIPDPLIVGISPEDNLDTDYNQHEGEINLPKDIKWLSNFEEAKKVGMGISIPLDEIGAKKIVKIIVLGLKLKSDKVESKELIQKLFEGHHYTDGGFSILKQGTPTNNTESVKSGFDKNVNDPEGSFYIEQNGPLFNEEVELMKKSDGQWFAEMLGLDLSVLQNIQNANGTDVSESIAMNKALWPSTLGYYLKQMLHPHVDKITQKKVRSFFTEYVMGRGKIPAFRIDDQPYGIIPSTVYSRWSYPSKLTTNEKFYKELSTQLLMPMNRVWEDLASEYVTRVGSSKAKPSVDFTNLMGLHASSVEFHQRYANGLYNMWNMYLFVTKAKGVNSRLGANIPKLDGTEISSFVNFFKRYLPLGPNFTVENNPKIFELNFLDTEKLLDGPVIDGFDRLPYSEERRTQPFPETNLNYMHWLLDSSTTIKNVREEFFGNLPGVASNQKPPKALLYLFLRHSYLLEYVDTSLNILAHSGQLKERIDFDFELQGIESEKKVSVEEKARILAEVSFEKITVLKNKIDQQIQKKSINISTKSVKDVTKSSKKVALPRHEIRDMEKSLFEKEEKTLVASIKTAYNKRLVDYTVKVQKWDYLSEAIPSVSGKKTMEFYIDGLAHKKSSLTDDLNIVKESIHKLKELSTARLERVFAEHLDTCNYRLDAWLTGLVSQRLEKQQKISKGSYIGAFGILENLEANISHPGIHVIELDHEGNELSTSPAIKDKFTYLGNEKASLERDLNSGKVRAIPKVDSSNNQGFIHAPSLNHAVTAAILRSGYFSHRDAKSNGGAFAVNLTSNRVKNALYYIEGLQNGQTLSSLLGYRFERELHDRSGSFKLELDKYILDIRLKYPISAVGLTPEGQQPLENNNTRNVVDGLALIEAFEETDTIFKSIVTSSSDLKVVKEAVDKIRNDMDAISDLIMSESIFQLSKGNLERSSAVLKSISEGGYVQSPEIVNTPRLGKVVTHRFGIHFDPTISSSEFWTGIESTPRSIVEPGLNGWIGTQLPDPSNVVFLVEINGEPLTPKLTLNDLSVQPIDLIYLVGEQGDANDASELSNRIVYYLKSNSKATDEDDIVIKYTETDGFNNNELSFFQVLPVITEIKKLIGNSRPMVTSDYQLFGDDQIEVEEDVSQNSGVITRFNEGFLHLSNLSTDLDSIIKSINPEILNGNFIELRNCLMQASLFDIQNIIPNKVNVDLIEVRRMLLKMATGLKSILDSRKNEVSSLLNLGSSIENVSKACQLLFGRAFKLFPEFQLKNAEQVNLSRANTDLLSEVGDLAVEEWVQSSAKVRSRMTNYQILRLLSDSITGSNISNLAVTQLPVNPDVVNKWVGMQLSETYEIPGDTLSMVFEIPSNNDTEALQAGILVDEWVEKIPDKIAHSGIAMHYNQPNAEAPNSLILAVSPNQNGSWEWNDLMDTVNETLEMAIKRAVEPDHLKNHVWGQVLPAILAPLNPADSAPSINFRRNIEDVPNKQPGFLKPTNNS